MEDNERYIKLLGEYISALGYIPACPTLCIPEMIRNYNIDNGIFPFFINQHKLVWYADPEWRKYGDNGILLTGQNKIEITFRDLALFELGIKSESTE